MEHAALPSRALELAMFTEEFRDRLSKGKYTRWAVDLDEEQVQAILLLLGEFGHRSVTLREKLLAEGEYSRAVAALEGLAKIVKGERVGLIDALMLIRNEFERAAGRKPKTTPDGMAVMIARGLRGLDPFAEG